MVLVKQLSLSNEEEAQRFLAIMENNLIKEDLQWLEWKYFRNPYSDKPLVFGAYDENTNKIVGIRPFILCRLVVGVKTFNAAQPCDAAVVHAYRKHGIFEAMNKHAVKELQERGYALCFNFPNHNSMPGLLKCGWQDTALVDESFCFRSFSEVVRKKTGRKLFSFLSFPVALRWNKVNYALKQLRFPRGNNLTIRKERDVSEEFELLWQTAAKNLIRVERSAEYLRWRFLERPDKSYEIWSIRDKHGLISYLVYTISDRWGTLEGQIVDFQYSSQKAFLQLLGHVLAIMIKEKGCKFVSIWDFTEKELFKQLRKIGFINRSSFPLRYFVPQRRMLVRVNDPELLEPSFFYNPANWSLRACDQDIY